VVADLRDAIQPQNLAIIGVDVPPAAWAALTSSQAWITSDSAWRMLLDETPQLQKEVAMQLRDYINNKKSAGQNYIYVFSLRDEKLFLYHV
jgi:translation initiation factor 2-alpha kinase 4